MTVSEVKAILSRAIWAQRRLNRDIERLQALRSQVERITPVISDMPKGVPSNNTIQQRVVELREKYIETRVSALEEYLKIEKYISSVEDSEIRTMMRLRFLDLKSWEDIGREYYCDRRTASRKVHKYIKQNAHNARQNVLL